MCSDPSQREFLNAPNPTDYYVLGKVAQGFSLLATEQDVDDLFQEVIIIGQEKWAIHSSRSVMNQGHGQTHDRLSMVANGEFIMVAYWTSLMDNTGAIYPDEEDSEEQAEHMENSLSVDDAQQDADFYPLLIHSTGFNDGKKFDKKYTIKFSVDAGEYLVPDELKGGY